MNIMIKSMKMPKNCDKCILSSSIAVRCDATEKSLVTDTYPKRPSWCPLVEVDDNITRFVEIAEQAGTEGKEAKFRMAGRLYAVRELPQ